MSKPTGHLNLSLLNEVHVAGVCFHARKSRPIWAKRLETSTRVPTLEGEEEVPAGTFLCRGEAGDIWPQTAERLRAKYRATNDITDDGWCRYQPHPDNTGVLAARIDHPFAVTATWGELQGKAGDFLVKNYADRNTACPTDLWIVDRALFEATYTRVADER